MSAAELDAQRLAGVELDLAVMNGRLANIERLLERVAGLELRQWKAMQDMVQLSDAAAVAGAYQVDPKQPPNLRLVETDEGVVEP